MKIFVGILEKIKYYGEHKVVCILPKQIKKGELTCMEEKYHVHRPLTALVQGAEYTESAWFFIYR